MPASSSTTRMDAAGALPLTADAETGRVQGHVDFRHGRNSLIGKLEMKRGACADRAFDMDFAGVLLNDAVADGEAQAGAALVAGHWSWW